MATPFIEEFLYRGRSADDPNPQPSAWHVNLACWVDNGFGEKSLTQTGPMTPAQASAKGFPLPTILAAINADILSEVEELRATNETLQKTVDDHAATIENLSAQAEMARSKESVA